MVGARVGDVQASETARDPVFEPHGALKATVKFLASLVRSWAVYGVLYDARPQRIQFVSRRTIKVIITRNTVNRSIAIRTRSSTVPRWVQTVSLTLGEGFTTQVVTLWCFNTVGRKILTLGEGFTTQVRSDMEKKKSSNQRTNDIPMGTPECGDHNGMLRYPTGPGIDEKLGVSAQKLVRQLWWCGRVPIAVARPRRHMDHTQANQMLLCPPGPDM